MGSWVNGGGSGGRGKPVLRGQGGAPTAEGSEVKLPVARTLSDPVGCNPPGSSAHGVLQARVPEGVASPAADRTAKCSCQKGNRDTVPRGGKGGVAGASCQPQVTQGHSVQSPLRV